MLREGTRIRHSESHSELALALIACIGVIGSLPLSGCANRDFEPASLVEAPAPAVAQASSALEFSPQLGLVGYWSFDRAVDPGADDSGKSSSSAQAAWTIWSPDGRSGGALYFNGEDSEVMVADGPWNLGNPVTYNLWYKSDGPPTGYVLDHEFTTTGSGAFAIDVGSAMFRSYGSTRRVRDQSFGAVPANTWTMVTVVADAGTIRVYKNATLVSTASRRLAKRAGSLHIGESSPNRNPFRGWIDEVAVFGRALNATEVASILNAYNSAPPASPGTDRAWSPLAVLPITNPMDFGAVGDGNADDLPALRAAVDALPQTGGIVFLPSGKIFRKTDVLKLNKSHVKLWAINREAEVYGSVDDQPDHQAIMADSVVGHGVFGVKLTSDIERRLSSPGDSQLISMYSDLVEYVGNDVSGSGLMLFGTLNSYAQGNYIHHTQADHIHHTAGASNAWVWDNTIFNDEDPAGDDGVACVTYGADGDLCWEHEWWNNVILHTAWGRGYAVIGGGDFKIHDNWAIGVAGAGIIVASEASFDTAASYNISITRNYVAESGRTVPGHPGILISSGNDAADPLEDIMLDGNVSVDNLNGPYRAEPTETEKPGRLVNVVNTNMSTDRASLPPRPNSAKMADTRVLRTRDISYVAPEMRHGLHRIHVRRASTGTAFEQRFEYVLKGEPSAIAEFVQMREVEGDYLSEQRMVGDRAYALLLTSTPVVVPSTIDAVEFSELREGDRTGTLSWLWQRVSSGEY